MFLFQVMIYNKLLLIDYFLLLKVFTHLIHHFIEISLKLIIFLGKCTKPSYRKMYIYIYDNFIIPSGNFHIEKLYFEFSLGLFKILCKHLI